MSASAKLAADRGQQRNRTHQASAAQSHFPTTMGAVAAVAAGVIVYLRALSNGFVWDDPLVLEQLKAIRTWGDLLIMPPEIPNYYYRPVIFVSYLIDRALGGGTPFWFHLSVVVVHALNCLLVFRLAMHLLRDDWAIATAAAVLFGVLPTHVESVAWMAGRSDVIVCSFLLLTVLLAFRRDASWSAWVSGITLFLALLSKEMAVAGLFMVPLLDWLSTRRLLWSRYVPLLLATAVYFALRHGSVGGFVGGDAASAESGQLAVDLVQAVGFYLIRSLLPFGLSPFIPTIPPSPVYLVAGLLLPLASAVIVYSKWPQTRWPLAFLLAWFGLTLAPSFTVILRTSASAPVADRYLYVPSVATCILVVWVAGAVTRRRRLASGWCAGIGVVACVALGISTATYARVWKDNVSFWGTVAVRVPRNGLVQRELGSALFDRGEIQEAERTLKVALALPLEPSARAIAYSQLGLIYRQQGHPSEAIDAFESALQLGPHPAIYHNLGMTLMAKAEEDQRQGQKAAVADDVRRARAAFESALSLQDRPGGRSFLDQWDPAKTHGLLGQVLISLGDRAGAREHLQTALRLQPTGKLADVTRRQLEKIAP